MTRLEKMALSFLLVSLTCFQHPEMNKDPDLFLTIAIIVFGGIFCYAGKGK